MTRVEKLAETHIREYESHLKHIDEVMEKASLKAKTDAELSEQLKELRFQRGHMVDYIEELKQKAPFEWMEEGGPMVLWDIMAERIERLIERINYKS